MINNVSEHMKLLENLLSNYDEYQMKIRYVKWQNKWQIDILKNKNVYGFCQSDDMLDCIGKFCEALKIDINHYKDKPGSICNY